MRWNKSSMEKARKFLSLLCFGLCITWSKQVSSLVTKTRARTFLLDWEQSLHFLFESQKIESRGERRSREERGRKPVPRGKRTLSAQALPQFLLLFNMICVISLFRLPRVAMRKEGRLLRVYFLCELFHCSQTQLSDVTIPFPSYQLHYRQGNTISFPEQWYA